MNINKEHKQKSAIYAVVARIVLVTMVGGLLLSACGAGQDKTFTIGIISYVSVLEPVIEGFKAEMTELGYVEGENLRYIYNGVVEPNPQAVDAEIENLMAQDADMLFSVGNLTTLRAKQAVEGTDMPVVFGSVINPVEEGFVESIAHPGGNLTGSQSSNQTPKTLEWLVTITPEADKVYVPYNPDDEVSMAILPELEKASSQLGIELVLGEVYSVEEAVAAIESLPEDVDAIFRIASPTLDPQNNELSQAAIKQGFSMGASLSLDEAVLLTITGDLFGMGKQAARLADQILGGTKPADLPVETGDFFMIINLQTAQAIGLDIPDTILRQADTVVR